MQKRLPSRICLALLILLAGLFLFPSPVRAQSGVQPHWDGDGGYTGDYSTIPLLEWAGPGQPGTYEEYMAGREQKPLQASHLLSSSPGRLGGRVKKALVLVNTGLYSGIQTALGDYVADLVDQGYTVDVHQISGGTPVSLKAFILANVTDLVGCVFVGDQPAAWYNDQGDEFPCDLFYMDLDGEWLDTDYDGVYDGHSSGTGDEGPEIFVGRIDTSMMSGSEAAMTNQYFYKNHLFRTGGIPMPDFGMTYTEDDWAMYTDICTDIKYAYPNFEEIRAPSTNMSDYRDNRLPNTTYEFIQLSCHSSSQAHYFTRGGQLYNSTVQSKRPYAVFYNLFCCSTLRWTSSDYLGGAYIYDAGDTSLAVIGSTKSGSMLEFWAFYQPLGNDECFGEAFRQWFNTLAPYSAYEISWHFGMTVSGDPFLTQVPPALRMSLSGNPPVGMQPPGLTTDHSVEIQNGLETYVPGSGKLFHRFDGGTFSETPLTAMGGGIHSATMPAPRSGDEPEYYFQAAGSGGTVITLPADAPASLYSFDVGLVGATLFHDDFEGDKGWTVQDFNLTVGTWERAVPNTTSGGQVAPVEDNPSGTGTHCFLTANGPPGSTYSDYDVDGGPTILTSPVLDLGGSDALVSCALWFYSRDGNDNFEIDVSNDGGTTWTNVLSTNVSLNGWESFGFAVGDYVSPSSQIHVRFSAQDQPNDDIVEAGLDDFLVQNLDLEPSLWAGAYAFQAAAGCDIPIYLDAGGSYAGRAYRIAGGLSGSIPGTPLPGGIVLPLNWDWLTTYMFSNPGSPLFVNFKGNFDSQGEALAALVITGPGASALAGSTLTFAYALTGSFDFVSNPLSIAIEP
jgi:hypothetical protein